MSQTADDTKAAETALLGKVDQLLTAFGDAKTQNAALAAQITALQAQVASLPLSPTDQAELQTAIAEMQAKASAIDSALTPAAPTAPASEPTA